MAASLRNVCRQPDHQGEHGWVDNGSGIALGARSQGFNSNQRAQPPTSREIDLLAVRKLGLERNQGSFQVGFVVLTPVASVEKGLALIGQKGHEIHMECAVGLFSVSPHKPAASPAMQSWSPGWW